MIILWSYWNTNQLNFWFYVSDTYPSQWRIQDFPEVGTPTPKLVLNCKFFAENCMKMKKIGPGASPWRPLGSTNASVWRLQLDFYN